MEHGKKICKALKNIRSLVAQANDIPLQIEECTYEGHCTGTCPKCESEARFLEEALQQRRDKGLPIRVEHLMSEEHLRQIVESSSDENNFDNNDFAPLQGMPMPPEYWDNGQVEETDDDIHVLEGDIAAPEDGQLVNVKMGMPAPENVYKEKRRVLYKECQIAGITFHDLGDVWDELYEGAELALIREKDNTHGAGLTVYRTYAVRHSELVQIPTLDCAGVTATLGDARDVDLVACGEGIGGDHVTNVECGAILQTELLQILLQSNACLLEMTLLGLGQMLFLNILEAELNGVIAVFFRSLLLCNNTGAGCDYRDRDHVSGLVEDLRHTDLLTDNTLFHFCFLL